MQSYNGVNLKLAEKAIKRHYSLSRSLTPEEIKDEIDNLIRRYNKMSLDDFSEKLYYSIFI